MNSSKVAPTQFNLLEINWSCDASIKKALEYISNGLDSNQRMAFIDDNLHLIFDYSPINTNCLPKLSYNLISQIICEDVNLTISLFSAGLDKEFIDKVDEQPWDVRACLGLTLKHYLESLFSTKLRVIELLLTNTNTHPNQTSNIIRLFNMFPETTKWRYQITA
jgi:hypothetical protein